MAEIFLSKQQYLEFEKIACGAFAPLKGFMNSEEYQNVVEKMRLPKGDIFPLPIVLDVDAETAKSIKGQARISLFYENCKVGEIEPEEVYSPNKNDALEKLFGTKDETHPGVTFFLNMKNFLIGGPVHLNERVASEYGKYDLSPAQTRDIFKKLGWKTVAGFQTRNVPHRAHEHLQRVALELTDGLFIQPLVGWKKRGDYTPDAILLGYKAMLDEFYPSDRVVMGVLATSMRYAGPREAVFHALIRRNYGCTHFVVGRDHAGVGNFYGKYEAQQLAIRLSDELGIEILPLHGPYFCQKCGVVTSAKTCRHEEDAPEVITHISGTDMRDILMGGREPDPHIMRAEVIAALRDVDIFIEETES
jgi:sulfate adenylyltransferase